MEISVDLFTYVQAEFLKHYGHSVINLYYQIEECGHWKCAPTVNHKPLESNR